MEQERVTFWDSCSWTSIILRQVIGQAMLILGTGEVDIGSLWDKLWDKMSLLFGTGEVEIGSQQDKLWDKTRWHFGTGEVDIISYQDVFLD